MELTVRYQPSCTHVVSVDPGKTYGVALYSLLENGWQLWCCKVATGIPRWLHCIKDYDVHLICEGTSFGGAGRYIQRCVGRFEGVLGTEALTVTVGTWRRAVFTPSQYKKTRGKNGGRVKWKQLAVKKCGEFGLEIPDQRDNDHAAEAALIGFGYVRGLIPPKKINGL